MAASPSFQVELPTRCRPPGSRGERQLQHHCCHSGTAAQSKQFLVPVIWGATRRDVDGKRPKVGEQDEEQRKARAKVVKIGIDPHYSFANMLCDVA